MTLKKILLVDDSQSEQFLYKYLIEAHDPDITLMSAYDGQEAMDILDHSDEKPLCILLDINMPRMNGFDFLEAYSQKYKDDSVIIPMLASPPPIKDKEKIASYSFVKEYFTKPLDIKDLERLSELIGK